MKFLKEKSEKDCQEMYGMNLEQYFNLNKLLDKRAEYVAQKFIAISRLLNHECEGMDANTEERLMAKIHARIVFKAQKLDEERKGKRKYVGTK